MNTKTSSVLLNSLISVWFSAALAVNVCGIQTAPNEGGFAATSNARSGEYATRSTSSRQMLPVSKGIELFKARVAKTPADYRSRLVLGRLYMRDARENDCFDSFQLAANQFQLVVNASPDVRSANVLLAEALMAQHRFREAEESLSGFDLQHADSVGVLPTMGDLQLYTGRYEQALATLTRLNEVMKTPATLARLARVKELTGSVAEARELLLQALEMTVDAGGDPLREAWYHWRVGKFYRDHGQFDDAIYQFQSAQNLSPDDPATLAELAFCKAIKGERSQAIQLFQESVGEAEEPLNISSLSLLLRESGQVEEADRWVAHALQLMDEESQMPIAGPAHARERATFFLRHNIRFPKALELAKQDWDARPDMFSADLLAWAHFKNGDAETAHQIMADLLSNDPPVAEFWYHAGCIEMQMKNNETARRHFEKAQSINRHFSLTSASQLENLLEALR